MHPLYPLISIVIPCYNEEKRFQLLEKAIMKFDHDWHAKYELILVDDGSRDETLSKMEAFVANSYLKNGIVFIISLQNNSGKGAALQAGVLKSQHPWILTCDADMATHPLELKNWLTITGEFSSGTVYIGSRIHKASKVEAKWYRKYIGAVYNLITRTFTPVKEGDTQCGFKLYPMKFGKNSFRRLKTMGWAHDIEVLSRCINQGAHIQSMPVEWEHQKGAKINIITDGFKMLLETIKIGLLLKKEPKEKS